MEQSRTLTFLEELAETLAELLDRLERVDEMLKTGADTDAVRDALQEGVRMTRAAVERLQTVVESLREVSDDARPFPEALEGLIDARVGEETEVDYESPELESELRGDLRDALLQAARGGIAHFTEYGDADRLAVAVVIEAEHIRLEISDRGSAFAPDELGEETAELSGIREEMRRVGGDLGLETSWREGSTIVATAPLRREN